jgi:hypothetical protein
LTAGVDWIEFESQEVHLEEKKEAGKVCGYENPIAGYKCNRDALPGDEHCIFHSLDAEGKKAIFHKAF